MEPRLLHHFLEQQAQQRPDHPVCIHGDEVVRYGTLEDAANRIASTLSHLGVQYGDRVGLIAGNSSPYLAAYYGILKTGAVVVALYTTTTPDSLGYVLNDCNIEVLLAGRDQLIKLRACAGEAHSLRGVVVLDSQIEEKATLPEEPSGSWESVSWSQVMEQTPGPRNPRIEDSALASIVYTSGSTAEPRGAMLSHRNIVANTRSINDYLDLSPQDRTMTVLPFPYVYGTSIINTHVAAGGTVLIDNRFPFPNLVLRTMQAKGATGFSGVPSTYAILLGKSAVRKMNFPSLRYLTQAGGAMPPRLIREVMDTFPGKQLFVMYGATEASARLTFLPPPELSRKLGSIGKPILDVELSLIRDDGREALPGETGEIVARGPNIMQGYWNQPDETRAVLTEHGFHTGDLGRMDEEGFFYVVGRKRDMIKSGANRVSAKEIEEVISDHPNVMETAVIGVPDQYLGEAICAFVVPSNDAMDLADLVITHCRKSLPEYKVPRSVLVRAQLPKNASGKIMKEQLRNETGEGSLVGV